MISIDQFEIVVYHLWVKVWNAKQINKLKTICLPSLKKPKANMTLSKNWQATTVKVSVSLWVMIMVSG